MLEKKLLLIVNPVAGIRRVNNMLLDIVQTFCEEGYECTTQTAAHNIVKNKTKELDIGSFNGRVFAYTASFGMFTKASYSTRREMKNSLGYFAYVLSGAKELGDIHSYNVKITSGDKIVEGEYIFGGICNSKRIGGLFQLPQDIVDMNDGLLEALFIKMPQNAHEFMQLIFDLNTNNFDSTMFDFYSTENLIVETNENIDWTIDGEYQKGDKKVEIKALKSAIQLIV